MANITLPEPEEGFEYVKVLKKPTLEEQLNTYKNDLKLFPKPSDKELIEFGKYSHPYYQISELIASLEEQISIK